MTYQYSGNLPQTNFLDSPFNPKDYSFFSTKMDILDTLSNNFGINPLVYHNVSAFAQAYYSLKKFRFMGGVRVDDNSLVWIQFKSKAGRIVHNESEDKLPWFHRVCV